MRRDRKWFAWALVATYLVWFAAFQVVGRYAATLPTLDPTTALDRAIPFQPSWVWIYELCYVFPFLPLFVVRDGERLARALLAVILANVTAFAVYVALPLAWPLPDPGPTLAGRVLAMEQAADFHPGANKLPSMHVAFAWFVWLVCRRQWLGRAGDATVLALAVAISASTAFVKQHVVADVLAGVGWAFASWAAAGRLLRAFAAGATSAREAFGKVTWRAGVPAVLAVPALIGVRMAIERWLR